MSEKKANRNATSKSRRERQRGRILTETGWNKLDVALQAWEAEQDCKRTFERIAAETQLDPGTVAKIFKRKEGADLGKLERLFETFQLQLEAADHRLVPQGAVSIADLNFVGRTQAIADLNQLIDRGTKVIVIQARGGVGKTTLARKYLQQEFESVLEFPIAKETKDIASIESLIEEKLRQLGEEPGREFFVSLDRLKRKLQVERIGILIDNLEPALDATGKLIEPHRRYVELLRVLADPSVQSVTLITSRERLNEYSVSVQHYLLEELSLADWNQFFQHRFSLFAGDQDVSEADQTALTSLHKAYGGNAKAMDILCGAVLTDYSGNITAYWQANQDDLLIERALEDLVVGQFDRLQQLDLDAYKLLCRMGCYRYQDVPNVPIEGLLCLLWDVPENRQRRVVKSLQERSLVEFENGEYWLHPVIRGEAITRLEDTEDWKAANSNAAEFWTKSVSNIENFEDAITALEAYYQYFEIGNFEDAASVLLKRRKGSIVIERLGRSFYKLGLFQQIISAINSLIDKLDSEYHLCGLYSMLGVPYQIVGRITDAIDCHTKSGRIAVKLQEKKNDDLDWECLKNWELHSLLNLGFCNLELWEIEEAICLFEKHNELAKRTEFYRPAAEPFLAFLYSCSRLNERAYNLAERAYQEISLSNKGFGSVGYRLVFLGLTYNKIGEVERSLSVYKSAIAIAEEAGHAQVKGKAFTGLGELFRGQEDFDMSISYLQKALGLLEEVGAKYDLAEAYYQLGLTYQTMKDFLKSIINFQEAIRLFTEMEAPKQVERVRRSINTETGS